MGKMSGSGSGMNNPKYLNSMMRIRDGKNSDPGSEINMDPQRCFVRLSFSEDWGVRKQEYGFLLSGLSVFSKEFAALGCRLLVLIVRCAVGCICLLQKNSRQVCCLVLTDGC
jgi:hypothetical protein